MALTGYKQVFAIGSVLLFACRASGQNAGLSMVNAPGVAGMTVTVPVSLGASSETQVAALQWSFSYAETDIVSVQVTAGAAAGDADKTIVCDSTAGNTTCLLYGMNRNFMSNGVIAEATFELSERPHSSIAVQLKNVVAATPDGASIPVSGDSEATILVVPRPPRRR